jgi:hypothetical protein
MATGNRAPALSPRPGSEVQNGYGAAWSRSSRARRIAASAGWRRVLELLDHVPVGPQGELGAVPELARDVDNVAALVHRSDAKEWRRS